jgi:Fe-S oxidoreductase/FAD/FMN-containing dehydrogenase
MNLDKLEKDLKAIMGGEGVTTSPFECWFYSHDFVSVPEWVRRLFKTMPVAVVKPRCVADVSKVVAYCAGEGIPVVPRGGGTSGLFSAVPKKGGVVLDLRGLSGNPELDADTGQVRTDAGITWWELERFLQRRGMALRSYPSSAKSATVAGWIMGTGLGIGSLKYGPVFGHVVSAEIVHSDGTTREYSRPEDLQKFYESEGTLGVMTGVTLKARKIPSTTAHHLVGFDAMADLYAFVEGLTERSLSPYAAEIFDASYLSLVRQAGYEAPFVKKGGGAVLVALDGEADEVAQSRCEIGKLCLFYRGEELEGAEREWEHRFHMLRIRRVLPTVLPMGVKVPVPKMQAFYKDLYGTGKRVVGLLGHVVSRRDCMFLPMLGTDRNDLAEYSLALHVPSRIFDLALSLGGKPAGGVGVWNGPYKERILGKERVAEIKELKKELDPRGILNPGIWSETPLLFSPGIYHIGMKVADQVDRIFPSRIGQEGKGNVDAGFGSCVQCGYCMNYCPTRGEWVSSTPRGRILKTSEILKDHALGNGALSKEYVESIFQCTLCGRCAVDCSVKIDSPAMWVDLRHQLVKAGAEPDSLKCATRVITQSRNTAGKQNGQRADWAKRMKGPTVVGKNRADLVYFVGCVTSFFPMVQDIARSFVQTLGVAGIDFTVLGGEEWCCGYPLLSAGHQEEAKEFMRHNTEVVQATGAKRLVVTCPGCYRMWKDEYAHITGGPPPVEVIHSTELLQELIQGGKIGLNPFDEAVTYHDPCDLGRVGGIYDPPRAVIRSIPGLRFTEMENTREYSSCCGSGGDLLVSNQDLSLAIAKRKADEILATGAKMAVTACPSCMRALVMTKSSRKLPFDVMDITQLVWRTMTR